jgi:hypothetical protein
MVRLRSPSSLTIIAKLSHLIYTDGMKTLISALFILSCLGVAFAADYGGMRSSMSSQDSVRGRVISVDKENGQLTIQDSSTGSVKTYTALNPVTLNLLKGDEQVEIYLTISGQIQSVVEK